MNLDRDEVRAAPWKNFQVRHEARDDAVADQAGQAFLDVQRFAHAAHMSGGVFNADEQGASRRVGEGHEGAQRPVRRGEVALELERLAFGALEQFYEVHDSEFYSEEVAATKLRSSSSSRHSPPQGEQ